MPPNACTHAGSLTRIAQKLRQRVFKLTHMRAQLQASPKGEVVRPTARLLLGRTRA